MSSYRFNFKPKIGSIYTRWGQSFTAVKVYPAKRKDGSPTTLVDWETQCSRCGGPLICTTGMSVASVQFYHKECQAAVRAERAQLRADERVVEQDIPMFVLRSALERVRGLQLSTATNAPREIYAPQRLKQECPEMRRYTNAEIELALEEAVSAGYAAKVVVGRRKSYHPVFGYVPVPMTPVLMADMVKRGYAEDVFS